MEGRSQFNNQLMNSSYNPEQNNMNMNCMNNMNSINNFNNMNMNAGNFISQMSPQQYQWWMMYLFEMEKQLARQNGELLKRQKELVEEMKKKEEARKNEDREIILFFKHNYNVLPLEFRQSTLISEALMKYMELSKKENPKFKFEDLELKVDASGKSLREIKGLLNGSEIIVEC